MQSDYSNLRTAMLEVGGYFLGVIGRWEGVRYEGWCIGEHGLIVAVNEIGNGVGIYKFVGANGAPVESDIEFVRGLAKTPQTFVSAN